MLTATASLVFWFGGVWRVRAAISEPQKRPLCLALLAFGIGAMFDIDPFFSTFDRAVHIANLSDLVAHGLGLVGIYFLMMSLDGLVTAAPLPTSDGAVHGLLPSLPGDAPSRSSRWLLPCLSAALVTSALLFAVTPMARETSAFTAEYGHEPTIAAYWAISILFPVLCLVQLNRTIVAHWSSPNVALRRGLKVCGVGVLFGYAYAALKLAELISASNRGHNLASDVRPIDRGLLGVGLFLIAVGLGSPSVVAWTRPRVQPRIDRYRVQRSLRRLKWIWTKFCLEARAASVIDVGPPNFLLVRRVVETRDGQAVLWNYLSAADIAQVTDRLWRERRKSPTVSEIEAGALALALRRELTGVERGRPDDEPPVPRPTSSMPATINLYAEVDELVVLGRRIRKGWRDC